MRKFNPATDYPDQVRWFDPTGKCECGKSAVGKLMGPRNESYGAYCAACAKKRLDRAKQEQSASREYLAQSKEQTA